MSGKKGTAAELECKTCSCIQHIGPFASFEVLCTRSMESYQEAQSTEHQQRKKTAARHNHKTRHDEAERADVSDGWKPRKLIG